MRSPSLLQLTQQPAYGFIAAADAAATRSSVQACILVAEVAKKD